MEQFGKCNLITLIFRVFQEINTIENETTDKIVSLLVYDIASVNFKATDKNFMGKEVIIFKKKILSLSMNLEMKLIYHLMNSFTKKKMQNCENLLPIMFLAIWSSILYDSRLILTNIEISMSLVRMKSIRSPECPFTTMYETIHLISSFLNSQSLTS